MRVDRHCTFTIAEFKVYTYGRRRQTNENLKEIPRDWMNHAMDAWGYYVWVKKRFEGEPEGGQSYSYLDTHIEPDINENVIAPRMSPEVLARQPQSRGRMFMDEMRSYHQRGPLEPRSYLSVAD
jgi:hypothetical protein